MNAIEVRKLHDRLIKQFYDFYRYTDSAHRIDHIRGVMSNVIRICYIQAFNWVLNNKPVMMRKYKLTFDECYTIAYAAMEHRGSFKGNYNSIISEIVAAADRGIPSKEDVTSYISRSYLYARDSQGKSISDSKFHAVNHIQDKFGRNAYAKVPDWYEEIFATQLAERLELIEMLDIDFFTPELVEELENRLKQSNPM